MELPKTAQIIPDSIDHWIDIDGSVYSIDHRNSHNPVLIKKSLHKVHGYMYCGINYQNKGIINKRVHRLVAEAFIPNQDNLPVVGHKNNIKSDNRVENLYWTTIRDNTQKAVDDGLLVNKKGYEDSQSKPINMYNTYTNELIGQFGGIKEAARKTGLSSTTISRQAKYKRPVRKPYYFRYADDVDCTSNMELIGMFDYDTDKIIKSFINSGDASIATDISQRTILDQCHKGKPKYKCAQFYFQRISNNKCEETIEI